MDNYYEKLKKLTGNKRRFITKNKHIANTILINCLLLIGTVGAEEMMIISLKQMFLQLGVILFISYLLIKRAQIYERKNQYNQKRINRLLNKKNNVC